MSAARLYLLEVAYDGESGRALLRFYDEGSSKLVEVQDPSGHKPYLLTDLPPEDLIQKYPEVVRHKGFDHLEVAEKHDALRDVNVKMVKVVARDPLSIGGSRGAIRELLNGHAWEAKIKYHHCYIYDQGLIPGMPYVEVNGKFQLAPVEVPQQVLEELRKLYGEGQLLERALEWVKLFQAPIPRLKRVALDIEVYSPEPDRIPRPDEAPYPIISISLYSSDGLRKVLLLKKPGLEISYATQAKDFEMEFYTNEREMIEKLFKIISEYPLVITFNGDLFDLPYLKVRAMKLSIREEEIPIEWRPGVDCARLKSAIHIDLYRFFTNKSMRVYAFGNKYREGRSLDEISDALLGVGKVKLSKPISQLSYDELASYSFRDAELTYKLTKFDDDLVIKLMILMARISKLGLEDLRRNISSWIRSMLFFEHRRRGYLIPNEDDVRKLKGQTDTRAIIKGKKYLGAVVINPLTGIFFNVVVIDFASLYPSVIKVWNLSYETVRCPHQECTSNGVPGLSHWVCTKRQGTMSEVVGLLRDFRVYIYKKMVKSEKDPVKSVHYNVVQSALKVFINASYGVFGAESFPLYCPAVAEATTALGRYLLLQTLSKAVEVEVPVLYGDTDSLFLWNPSPRKLEELVSWVGRTLGVDIDVDKTYRWVAFSGRKKNYVGVLVEGSIDAKGIVGKKRNTPEFIKNLVSQAIALLSKADNLSRLDEAIDRIRKLTLSSYESIKRGEIPLHDLVFKVTLTKPLSSYVKSTPQHVKAARQLQRARKQVEVGDVISFVKVKGGDGVKAVQLARIDEIEADKYVEHLRTALEQVLEALGTSFEEVITGTQLVLGTSEAGSGARTP